MELSRMTWTRAREELRSNQVALLPVGSTEQHGPHLPLGTDWMVAEEIARRASEAGGWVLLPTVPVGVSEHHRQFWGTLWVPPDVLRGYVAGIGRALASHGLTRLVLVNGHGGNTPALEQAARALRGNSLHAFVFVWWRAIADVIEQTVGTGGSHAGEMETASVLAVRPQLVQPEAYQEAAAGAAPAWGKTVCGVNVGWDTIDFSRSGAVGDPAGATPEVGEQLIAAAAARLDEFCRWLQAQPGEDLAPKGHLP
ncbi:MAG: creatininase family protein [Candidatus Bipolaricaulaceae bacterium]